MSWLSDIVGSINGVIGNDLAGKLYIGSDINAIDTAYSDTDNHDTSLFFVPLDNVAASDINGVFIKKRFACYVFVPKSDDPDGVDAWEICDNITDRLNDSLSAVNGEVAFVSGRIFREGRGYFIYVNEFVTTLINGSTSGLVRASLYLYTGEADGTATYNKTTYNECRVSKTYGVSRNTQGVDDNYTIRLFLPETAELAIGQKSWVVVEGMGDVDATYISQSAAEADGARPFEINSWQYLKLGDNVVGIEVNGV